MPSSLRTFTTVLALSTAASALPVSESIVDAVKGYLRQGRNTILARNVQVPFEGVPSCDISNKKNDPTYAPDKSNYTDGDGHYVGQDCTTGHNSDHCWTDYYLMGTKIAYKDWYPAMGDIYCQGNGSMCNQQIGQLAQECDSHTWGITGGLSVEFEYLFGKVTPKLEATGGGTYQTCNSNTSTQTCQWSDGNCHSVWAAHRVTQVYGYMRRSCVAPTSNKDANMPNSPKRGDGYYTRGMQDFVVELADFNAINCNGTCDSSWNPGPKPEIPGGDVLKPWTQS